jgi:hypothetical protein
MRYSKTVAGVAICAASVMGVSAGSAFAGEVNGNGDPTPIREGGTSACAFSGLEDGFTQTGTTDSGPGITQTPHYENEVTLPPGLPARSEFYNCVGLDGGSGPRP